VVHTAQAYAGLRDAYRFAGNKTALEVEIKFAAWAEGIMSKMTDVQVQRMLNTEFGGMNEIFVDLYADTGDARWLKLSYKFEHESFIEPLMRHQDNLDGKHGNTQIPKLIGSADRFPYTGQAGDIEAAAFFWDRVVQHHSYATGGDGREEYFRPGRRPWATAWDGRTAETCNELQHAQAEPGGSSPIGPTLSDARFQERPCLNHILASSDPNDGPTLLYGPVGRG
jgi:DUF1680 family protein